MRVEDGPGQMSRQLVLESQQSSASVDLDTGAGSRRNCITSCCHHLCDIILELWYGRYDIFRQGVSHQTICIGPTPQHLVHTLYGFDKLASENIGVSGSFNVACNLWRNIDMDRRGSLRQLDEILDEGCTV